MDRRFFIKSLPVLGWMLVQVKDAFSKDLVSILLPQLSGPQQKVLTILSPTSESVNIPLYWEKNVAYIASEKLAQALHCRTYFNDTKKKIVFYLPQNRVVVTANNAFVLIDNEAYQMPARTLWRREDIYLPVGDFFGLLGRHSSLSLKTDDSNRQIQVSQPDINITGVSITEKKNGTVIRVRTGKIFNSEEITTDMRYGWLHVDFYGGKTDSVKINSAPTAGLVKQIRTFQFPELASLAFRLKNEPLAREIIPKPENREVLIVLRTKENISENDLAELREENRPAQNKEIEKKLEEERRRWLIDVIVIDAGHGGKDPGAIGVKKLQEKKVVLPIALKLGKLIKKEMPGVRVIYTRDRDRFISLRRRTQIANENNGKIFISIHANSNRKKRVSGFETYILGSEKGDMAREVALKENSVINFEDAGSREGYAGINKILATMAQNAFSRQSEHLAGLVQQEIHKQFRSIKLPNRGIKQGPFWVMVGASMPNILVETGFLSNPYDAKILRTSSYQMKMAKGIFDGVKQFKRDYENAI